MTITAYLPNGRWLIGYDAQFVPPIGHILDIKGTRYQVLGSSSVIVETGRRGDRHPIEEDIRIDVIDIKAVRR